MVVEAWIGLVLLLLLLSRLLLVLLGQQEALERNLDQVEDGHGHVQEEAWKRKEGRKKDMSIAQTRFNFRGPEQ